MPKCGIPLDFLFPFHHVNSIKMITYHIKSFHLLQNCFSIQRQIKQNKKLQILVFSVWSCLSQNIKSAPCPHICAVTNNDNKAQCYVCCVNCVNVVFVHGAVVLVSSVRSLWKVRDVEACEEWQATVTWICIMEPGVVALKIVILFFVFGHVMKFTITIFYFIYIFKVWLCNFLEKK